MRARVLAVLTAEENRKWLTLFAVSFDVLCNEIKGLAINMELNKRNQPADGKNAPAKP